MVGAINNVPVPTFPARFSWVICVAAHDGKDPLSIDAKPEPPADFGAPGIDIEVWWLFPIRALLAAGIEAALRTLPPVIPATASRVVISFTPRLA